MKKFWLLTTLLVGWLLLAGCNGTVEKSAEDFVSYYDNWAIREQWTYVNWMKEWYWTTYDEGGNVIDVQEYKDWELIEDEGVSNVLMLKDDALLSVDELKQICEEDLKEILPSNSKIEWNEEKIFINTYWFKGVSDESSVYCNISLDWLVFSSSSFQDQWETIDQLHADMDFNVSWIGSAYPNLEEFYGFIGNVVLWDRIQTTYLAWKNILYFDNYRWIALRLWEVFDWWLIREIDTDENGYPHSEIIFLIKGDENEENRTWINWYREMFTITAISKQNLENFKVTPDFMESVIWENNQYYFTLSVAGSSEYKDLFVFDVK